MDANEKNTGASAKELLGSLTAGKAQWEGETQGEAPHQEQGVPEPAEAQVQRDEGVLDPRPADPQPALEPQGTEQRPEQNGKEPLPPDEREGAAENEDAGEDQAEEASEDEHEAEQEEPEPVFTEQDKADLPVLEAKVKHYGLDQARAIREIRQRKVWMLHRNDDGSRRYMNYDKYIDEYHGHTRQWATQQTQWLVVVEKLQELRATNPDLPDHLSANAVSGLWQLDAAGGYRGSTQEEQEENGLIAVVEEAKEQGVSFSRDNLRAICERRARYYRGKKGSRPPAAPTYAAYKQDCEAAKPLSGGSSGVVDEARKLPGSFADNLLRICTEQRKLPRAEQLLEVVTGTALKEIMPRLVTLAQDVSDTEAKMKLLKTRKAQIRAMQNEGGLASLREEAKALQTKLEEKGVLKKRGGSAKKNDAVAERTGKDEDADDTNEVQDKLDTALECLNAALTAEWPDAEEGVIQAILNSTTACDEALAEIANKAKELLADAGKPVKVVALPDPYFPED